VNNTFNVGKWLFGVVNVFGKWDGNINFGEGGTGGSINPEVFNAGFVAGNEETGAFSDNEAVIKNKEKNKQKVDNNNEKNKDKNKDKH
jgi:hypothetical protein